MRRSIRRRPVPYKSPRLFSMVALLVCLLLMMNSLNNMRGPGPLAQKIISNLDESIKQVGAAGDPQAEPQQANDQQPNAQKPADPAPPPAAEAEPAKPAQEPQPEATEQVGSAGQNEPNKLDTAKGELEEFPPGDSNSTGAPNLNLREDLELQDWLGLAQDGSLKMQKLEMPAYWRILGLVKNTSFSNLLKAANSKVRFNDLYSSPAVHRSKLLTLTVNIRKINRYETEENAAGVQELYEVWGWSETSKAWLYVFVTPELPPGLDADTPVNQTAKFAGYFFKLQGYQPGIAKPNAKPLLAPLLIGKFELSKPAPRIAAKAPATIEWIVGAVILAVGLAAILLRIFVFKAKKPKLNRVAPSLNLDIFPPAPVESADTNNRL
jgi:hypothetical protein